MVPSLVAAVGWTPAPVSAPFPKEVRVRAQGRGRRRSATALIVILGGGALGVATLATAAGASRPLGATHPATLPPVTIGLISDGGSGTVGTAPLVEQGARMAVAYQNAYGDGLEGHRIDLYICENDETPAGGQACANDMVQRGVAAVIEPFTGQGETEVPTVVKAGIPYITMSGGSTAELTTPGSFALQGGFPAILGAAALHAKQQGYKKVAFLVANVPSVVQATQGLGGLVFKAAGVGFQVVPVSSGTADMSPQLEAAVNGGASAVGEAGDVTFCGSFLRAYASLNLHVPRYVVATCLDPSILNSPSLDKVMRGSWLAGAGTASASNDALYAAIVHKYAPKVNPNPNASANDLAGMLPVLSLAAIMKGSTEPVTASGILKQTEAAKDVVLPMFGGVTFTCNGAAIPLLKSVCSSTAAIGVLGGGYRVSHVRAYDPTPLF
jgi:branched-chain amino acid transport system substrate-binding protein